MTLTTVSVDNAVGVASMAFEIRTPSLALILTTGIVTGDFVIDDHDARTSIFGVLTIGVKQTSASTNQGELSCGNATGKFGQIDHDAHRCQWIGCLREADQGTWIGR